jgi:hypothetical protein
MVCGPPVRLLHVVVDHNQAGRSRRQGEQKSECQKTQRYAREHGIMIAEAIARRRR